MTTVAIVPCLGAVFFGSVPLPSALGHNSPRRDDARSGISEWDQLQSPRTSPEVGFGLVFVSRYVLSSAGRCLATDHALLDRPQVVPLKPSRVLRVEELDRSFLPREA